MKILVVGLNHKTAPVDIREKLAFDPDQILRALRQLKDRFSHGQFVLLSTCNRVELYCAAEGGEGLCKEAIVKFLADFHELETEDFRDYLYFHGDEEAVRHMLCVTSSLDSMVVGEPEIVGQVKESYRLACTAKSSGKVLNRLLHVAFTTSKKIHTTTSISSGRVSVAGVAIELAKQLFADISKAKVVVIGAGQMGDLLVQHLLHVGSKDITVVNRTFERGQEMALKYGIGVQEWEQLNNELKSANIVVASASVQDYLFTKATFAPIMAEKKKGSLLAIDISVPRNFEPAINEIEDVYLYSIDELSEVAEQNKQTREDDIARGMQIIYEKVDEFMDWFSSRDIGPLIGQMKQQFKKISEDEMKKFFVGDRQHAHCTEAAEAMVHRIVNKLLHCVIKNVNSVAKEHGPTEAAKLVDTIVQQAEEITAEVNGKVKDNK
jgi:glutamyl-tRNA reductase